MDMTLYFARVQSTPSQLKRWQKDLVPIFEEFDRNLFTRKGIESFKENLEAEVDEMQERFKKDAKITGPDWEFADKYKQSPSISAGYGLYISFQPVAGYAGIVDGELYWVSPKEKK